MAQNFDNGLIAVSRLCCPVCWELLKIFRNDDSSNFHVDGYHKTLYQVELPDWLPLEIVVKLTARFETILFALLKTLQKNNKHRSINPSGQSGDGLSSDSSDGEDDTFDTIHHSYEVTNVDNFD
jgi:hypothetical protein